MENIIIPYKYGRGKTGNAINGKTRALIVDTNSYPNAFDLFRGAIKEGIKHFSNPEEAYNKCINYFLCQELPKNTQAQIQEIEFGKINFVFFNTNIYPRPLSIKTENYEIKY